MSSTLLPTTVVGSYPQPDWLVDRDALGTKSVPRIRARGMSERRRFCHAVSRSVRKP